jgi:hypothetical protein
MTTLFKSEGIEVWAEEGRVIIADEQGRDEYTDTEENREYCIAEAKRLVAEWESGR